MAFFNSMIYLNLPEIELKDSLEYRVEWEK